jgi:hypothetical protein
MKVSIVKNPKLCEGTMVKPIDEVTRFSGKTGNMIYQLKKDGERAFVAHDGKEARLCNVHKTVYQPEGDKTPSAFRIRNPSDEFFAELDKALKPHAPILLDAEFIVREGSFSEFLTSVANESGFRCPAHKSKPIACCENAKANKKLQIYAFDIMIYKGKDVTDLPLKERLELLGKIKRNSRVRVSQTRELTNGLDRKELLKGVNQDSHDGVVVKDLDAKYGNPNGMLKVKFEYTADVVITGIYKSEKYMAGGLPYTYQISVREGDNWKSIGKVGAGFDDAEKAMLDKDLIRTGEEDKDFIYVEPNTAIEISFERIFANGLRFPKVLRFRPDKSPERCVMPTFKSSEPAKAFPKKKSKVSATKSMKEIKVQSTSADDIFGVSIDSSFI